MVDTVPATRDACPADRDAVGCPHVRCRFHMWRLDGHDRPGRRFENFPGPPSTLARYSLESCALDIADENEHGMTCREIGATMGVSKRRVQQVLKKVLAALGTDEARIAELVEDPVEGDRSTDYGWSWSQP
jgi:hypothetical protein